LSTNSTIFEQPPSQLVKSSQMSRLLQFNAPLFVEDKPQDDADQDDNDK
jgi:hypothetical protein